MPIRVGQVASVLHQGGHISDELLERVQAGHRKVDQEKTPELVADASLLVELITLKTIYAYELLECFVSNFRVHVSEADRAEIIGTDQQFAALVETGTWHDQLWEHVRNSDAYVFTGAAESTAQDEEEGRRSVAALKLSTEKHVPFLVDDRVFQVARQNEEPSAECMTFGVDALLVGMHKAGTLNVAELTKHYCQLMEWRYRFLMPPVEVLMECARKHQGNPPGDPLRRIAGYLHECVRDPGLLAGEEETTPPMSIATYFAYKWTPLVARFVIEVWKDEAFSDEASEMLTQWAGAALLPSASHRMGPPGFRISQQMNRAVVTHASLYSIEIKDSSRAKRSLQCLVETLGMSNEEFIDAATDSLSHVDVDLAAEESKALASVFMRNVTGETASLHLRHVLMCKLRGLFESLESPSLDAQALAMLRREGGVESPCSVAGPLLFVPKNQNDVEVLGISDALLNEDREQRGLALQFLHSLDAEEGILCPSTRQRLDEAEKAFLSEDRREWTVPAIELHHLLREDFLLNLAGMRQSQATNYQEGLNEYISALLTPTLQGMRGLPVPVMKPTEQWDMIVEHLDKLSKESDTLEELLDGYFEYCGHLPLDGACSLGGLLHEWRKRNEEVEGLVQQLWAWADERKSPLARYHVCQALCTHADLLDDATSIRFWYETQLVICAGAEDEETRADDWKLRCQLAQHYCKHIESLNWSSDGEPVAAIAWWLAEKVSSLFGNRAENIRNTLDYLERSDDVSWTSEKWRLLRPVVQPSRLWYITLNVRSPWGEAAFGQLDKLDKERLQKVPETYLGPITDALCGSLWYAYCFENDEDDPVFAFDANHVLALADAWSELDKDEHRAQMTRILREAVIALSDPERLFDTLRKTEGLNDAELMLAVHGIKGMICTDRKALERVDALFAKQDWLERILTTSPAVIAEELFNGVAELVGQCHLAGSEKKSWFYDLPHTFADACEKSVEEDDDRRLLFFTMVVLVCLQTDTSSALHRLVNGSERDQFGDEIEKWRDRLEQARLMAPSALAARIRPILSTLGD